MLELGHVFITSGAMIVLKNLEVSPSTLLKRHQEGDWGELDDEDRKANQDALIYGLRVMSVYRVLGVRMWVITEANRSSTTILLPEEY
jgi:hypothetical protein